MTPYLGTGSISLLDMLRFYAEKFVNISMSVQTSLIASFKLDEGSIPALQDIVGRMHVVCLECGLLLSAKKAKELQQELNHRPISESRLALQQLANETRWLIQNELQNHLFFQIAEEKARFFNGPLEIFGTDVMAKFPDIAHDLEEAGKCYATARDTSCVFHLMRIMEAGLRFVCKEAKTFGLTVPDPDSNRAWDGWLKPIEKQLQKARQDKSADWNAVEPVFAQMAVHLRTVSTAWRNPVMHVGTKYTPEEAEDIFNATKGFMRHLASAIFRK